MNWLTLYIFLKLDVIRDALTTLMILVIILSTMYSMFYWMWYVNDGGNKESTIYRHYWFKKYCYRKLLIGTLLFSTILWIILPSTKEMFALYSIPEITNNERIKQIPNKALIVLDKKLDEWINKKEEDK